MTPTYEIDVTQFEQSREYESDSKLFVVFYRGAVVDDVASQEAGRPVHKDVDFVKIVVPGQRDNVVALADENYKARFPKQWAQYQANAEQLGSGTPLTEVTWLTPAQIMDLKAMNVRTVEQLAAIPDSQSHAFMGFYGLKQRAEAYLEAAAGNAPLIKMQAELESRDATIAAQQQQITALAARLDALAQPTAAPAGKK